MNRILLTLIFSFILFACQKDDKDPVAGVEPIVGSWRLAAVEKIADGKSSWENVQNPDGNDLNFRYDGVIVDSQGRGICCGPGSLVINGNNFTIKPKTELDYGHCAAVNCVYCPTWEIEVKDNELTVSTCGQGKRKYVNL
ncbi:hypothetical protein [Dyadobacter psychrotolerans]|uniref:Lipocalin-like domain-containing protein n=1 Tax=Dyadobacter psychrotolerans TaxID=2541721 RepID=A0A4R5DR22_9BACT|nr:hypothetical protein [Dyadobacter psychrotolerans]TDE14501.1 hypothetical protein E0F88_14980 [Dyadobacter psychrotolerans]